MTSVNENEAVKFCFICIFTGAGPLIDDPWPGTDMIAVASRSKQQRYANKIPFTPLILLQLSVADVQVAITWQTPGIRDSSGRGILFADASAAGFLSPCR